LLEVILECYSRIDEERLVVVSVIDEVVANLDLATKADILRHIIPELRLGEDDEHAVTLVAGTPVLTAPEIDEAREGALVVGKVKTPDTCELEAVIGARVVVALEVALVHQLYGPRLREVGIVTVVGSTQEGCMLETANLIAPQSAVVLNMGGEGRLFAELELTRNLGIGTAEELAAEVEVDEIVPGAQIVCLELLDGDSHLLASVFLVGVDVASEVVV